MRNPLVKEWVDKAEADWLTCQKLAADDVVPVADVICFHAQQCVEKYLRALLTDHRRDAPKIHSLKTLIEWCVDIDSALEELSTEAAQLEEYAVEFRYPGESATPDEAREALRIAEGLRQHLRAVLGLEVRAGTSAV